MKHNVYIIAQSLDNNSPALFLNDECELLSEAEVRESIWGFSSFLNANGVCWVKSEKFSIKLHLNGWLLIDFESDSVDVSGRKSSVLILVLYKACNIQKLKKLIFDSQSYIGRGFDVVAVNRLLLAIANIRKSYSGIGFVFFAIKFAFIKFLGR